MYIPIFYICIYEGYLHLYLYLIYIHVYIVYIYVYIYINNDLENVVITYLV